MNILILYKSMNGATKQYAEWIKEETSDSDLFSTEEFNILNIDKYDVIILGSCVYGGKMEGLSFLVNNWNKIKNKKILFFTVGVIPADRAMSKTMYNSIPFEIRNSVTYYKIHGQVAGKDPSKLQKWIFKKLFKGNLNSKIDKSFLKPIFEFINNNK